MLDIVKEENKIIVSDNKGESMIFVEDHYMDEYMLDETSVFVADEYWYKNMTISEAIDFAKEYLG